MRYQPNQSYEWNYEQAPVWDERRQEQLRDCSARLSLLPATSSYAGLPVRSPVAIAAGPLLNGRWCLAYAALGFEVVTYKTVRSIERACYPLPNLVPVTCSPGDRVGACVHSAPSMKDSWAVSFGMPSRSPEVWQRDIAWTREHLPDTHRLAVSVVGTSQSGTSLDELAADYARCARWAANSGADIIEVNFSCPNVCSLDGQLFQVPDQARQVAETVGDELARAGFHGPLLAKIGFQPNDVALSKLVQALSGRVTGCVMTNSVPACVLDADGTPLFAGQQRGICGGVTREVANEQIRRFRALHPASPLVAIGVGGIASADDIAGFIESGAEAVQVATSAMLYDDIATRLRLKGAMNTGA